MSSASRRRCWSTRSASCLPYSPACREISSQWSAVPSVIRRKLRGSDCIVPSFSEDALYVATGRAGGFSPVAVQLSFDVMGRQSFSDWHLPRALDGVLLFDDVAQGTRFTSQD